jgi:hypothetical protein
MCLFPGPTRSLLRLLMPPRSYVLIVQPAHEAAGPRVHKEV